MYADSVAVIQRYSTRCVPAAQRLSFWNDRASETYGPLVVDSARQDMFDGEIARLPLGACELTSVSSTPATVRYQRRSQGRATQALSLNLQVQVGGRCQTRHEEKLTELQPRDMTLFDPSKPYSLRFDEPTLVYVLRLPRAQLIERGLDLEPYVGQRVAGDRGAGSMLSAFVTSMWPQPDARFEDEWSESVCNVLFTLLDLVYRPQERADEQRSDAKRAHERAVQFIESRLCDPAFAAPAVAPALGVSARYVQKLFARSGTTPSEYLLKRRLDLAAARLRNDGPAARISDIAFSVGFNDISYFCRAFRRHFGTSPRNYRGSVGR